MKRFLMLALSAAMLVTVGAGCRKSVSGDWHVAFDLPQGWVIVAPYNGTSATPLDHDVTRADAEIVLQNVDKKIVMSDAQAETDVVRSGYTKISIVRYDRGRVAPEDAQSVNDQLKKDAQASKPTYYFTVGDFLYRATVETDSASLSEAESILTSAKEVKENK